MRAEVHHPETGTLLAEVGGDLHEFGSGTLLAAFTLDGTTVNSWC
jgi:hypothetical protein